MGLLVALGVFLVLSFAYNKVQTRREAIIFDDPIGQYVEVDGNKMCVYAEGEGPHTFVFLSGSGTASPILDFKSILAVVRIPIGSGCSGSADGGYPLAATHSIDHNGSL